MKKTASAVWQGGLKDGKAPFHRKRRARGQPYGFNTRFEGAPGTNPEELIGAAHAGCFSMALSMMLGEAGLTAERIETRAEVTLDKQSDGFAITAVHLVLRARAGADAQTFEQIANKAKRRLPGIQGAQREDQPGRQPRRLSGTLPQPGELALACRSRMRQDALRSTRLPGIDEE